MIYQRDSSSPGGTEPRWTAESISRADDTSLSTLLKKQEATLCAEDKHMGFVFDLGIQSGFLFLSPVYVRNIICPGCRLLCPPHLTLAFIYCYLITVLVPLQKKCSLCCRNGSSLPLAYHLQSSLLAPLSQC